jgi:hypothetical protein
MDCTSSSGREIIACCSSYLYQKLIVLHVWVESGSSSAHYHSREEVAVGIASISRRLNRWSAIPVRFYFFGGGKVVMISCSPLIRCSLIIDTGSSTLAVFASSYCEDAEVEYYHPQCVNKTFSPEEEHFRYSLLVDGYGVHLNGAFTTLQALFEGEMPGTENDVDFPDIKSIVGDWENDGYLAIGPLSYWNSTSGSLGLSYPFEIEVTDEDDKHGMNTNTNELIPSDSFLFHFQGHGFQYLQLTRQVLRFLPFTFTQKITTFWSEKQIQRAFSAHEAILYDMRVCGVDLLANYSVFRPAIFDSGAACLGLPGEIFDMLIAWIPMTCESGTWDTWCVPNAAAGGLHQPFVLPTLTFSLTPSLNYSSLHPGRTPRYSIDLHHLILPPRDPIGPSDIDFGKFRLCLVKGPYSLDTWYDNPSRISIGSMVLEQWETTFDIIEHTVGLRQQHTTYPSKNGCAVPRDESCVGQQWYYAPMNKCMEPVCSNYWFHEADTVSHICVMSWWFYGVALVCAGVLLTPEVLLYVLRIVLQRLVERRYPPLTDLPTPQAT